MASLAFIEVGRSCGEKCQQRQEDDGELHTAEQRSALVRSGLPTEDSSLSDVRFGASGLNNSTEKKTTCRREGVLLMLVAKQKSKPPGSR